MQTGNASFFVLLFSFLFSFADAIAALHNDLFAVFRSVSVDWIRFHSRCKCVRTMRKLSGISATDTNRNHNDKLKTKSTDARAQNVNERKIM